MTSAGRIVVIGGGIGGLTAALALLRQGIEVEVYEQSKELKEVGAGVQIGANGTRVLHALGLKEPLERSQVVPSGKEARLWNTGQSWKTLDLGAISVERYGAPHIMMHRGDLHAILVDAIRAIRPDVVQLGQRCAELTQSSEGVGMRFESGKIADAALVIGADGIHSKVRQALFGQDSAQFTGCVAWRGLVPMHQLPHHLARNTATSWLGPAGHVLHYPVRRGELMNFIAFVERDDWRIESWTVAGTIAELANDFRGWHADVHEIIRNIDVPYKWALWVRPPMERWSAGRVTLLGDACHPTLPFLGQGAVMAIEDAYVLAGCLKKYAGDHTTALAQYENARRDRTAAVVRASAETRNRAFNHALADAEGVAAYLAREWEQEPVMARYDKVYAYDATSVAI
jgi:salicylate hydroxylase